jgi:hypothetical protein
VPKKVEAGAALANCRALISQINAGLSAEKPLVNVSSAAELLFYLEFAASCSHKVRTTAAKARPTRESSALRTNGTSRIWSNSKSHFRRKAFAVFY